MNEVNAVIWARRLVAALAFAVAVLNGLISAKILLAGHGPLAAAFNFALMAFMLDVTHDVAGRICDAKRERELS